MKKFVNLFAGVVLAIALASTGCGGSELAGAGGAGGSGTYHEATTMTPDPTRTPPPAPKATPKEDLETNSSAIRCADPYGAFCFGYQPDFPPGGRDCTGAPGWGEVNIYTQPGRGGWCVTIPATEGWWNLTSSNGWYNFFYVKDIEVSWGVTNGWVCSGPNATVACYPLSPGYNYSYNNPPYASNQPGWQSIYVGP